MATYYCEGWFRAKKYALAELSESEAQRRHMAGVKYCALVGSRDRPVCFLEIVKGFVGVGFLDELLRENLSYQIQEKAPGRLFLSMAIWREFDGTTDTVREGTTYVFDPTGSVSIRREAFSPDSMKEARAQYDVSRSWSSIPEFGKYADLTRSERHA